MQYVIEYDHKVTTTSLLVAQKFEKRHDDVLRAIRTINCSDEFRLRNFTESDYVNNRGKKYPMVILTRDAFTMLVMSFSGSSNRAAKFREEFIEEFNRMEAILRQGSTPVLIPTYQMRILSEPTKKLPKGFWSVFDESHGIMLFIEKNIGSLNKYDLADGSIGIHWARYREDKSWTSRVQTYPHEYDDNRGTKMCKCYEYYELQFFREWLIAVYKQTYLIEYLLNKYKKDGNLIMVDKVKEVLPKLLKAS